MRSHADVDSVFGDLAAFERDVCDRASCVQASRPFTGEAADGDSLIGEVDYSPAVAALAQHLIGGSEGRFNLRQQQEVSPLLWRSLLFLPCPLLVSGVCCRIVFV
jgi:hypothetical protein